MKSPQASQVRISPGRISIILSFFNEADVIPELVRRLRSVLEGEVKKATLADFEL